MISQSDRERITAAIAAAETRTSGEIICVIAARSGLDLAPPVVVSALIALIAPLPLVLVTDWSAGTVYAGQIIVFLVLLARLAWGPLRHRLVPKPIRHARAHDLALRHFFAQGLHATSQRTGVLIFASAGDRYAEIVADITINARVPQATWDAAITALTGAIKEGRAGDGFLAAIEMCGQVLAEHFPPGTLNPDEVPNKLIEI